MPLSNYDAVFQEAGTEWNVDPRLLKAVAQVESGGQANARSPAGARGLMQIMPDTGRALGATNLDDPVQSIWAAAKYLSQGLDAEKTPEDALRFYHGGPGWRAKYGPESQNYAPLVTAAYQQTADPGGKPAGAVAMAASTQAQTKPAKTDATDDFLSGKTDPPAAATPTKTAVSAKTAAPAEPDATDDFLSGKTGPEPPAQQAEAPAPAASNAVLGHLPGASSVTSDAPMPTMPSGLPVDPDETAPAPTGWSAPPIPEPVKRIGGAMADAWNAPNSLMTPELQRMIESGGPVGRYITSPLLQAGGWAMGGAGALTAGGLAAANELVGGGPLGRDVAQMLQLMPEVQRTGGLAGQTALPQAGPRNALAPGVDRPYLTPEAAADIAASRPNMLRADANETSPTAVPTFSGGPAMAVRPDAAPPATVPVQIPARPGAAGADVTTEPIPPSTPAQKATELQKMIGQSAEDRLTPQGRDDNVYFPGVTRPEAMKDFSPAPEGQMSTALQHKTLYNTDSHYHDQHDAQIKANNAVMSDGTTLPDGTRVDGLKDMFGDANTRDKAMDHARELMPGSVDLFKDEKPVDVQPIADKIKKILASGAGKTDAVANTLKGILPKLYDAEGKLETLPSIIKGIFDDINNKLYDKSPTTEGNAARMSANQLKDVKAVVSDVIGKGLPGTKWKDYLANLSDALGQVNKLDYMQRFLSGPKGLWGSDGLLKFNKVKNMLQDILDHHADQTGGARQMTMEEINKIEAVRNELAAKDLLDRRADVRGSPTVQLGTGAGILGSGPLGTAVKTIAEGGAHLALAPLTAGVGNVGLLAAKGWAAGRKAKAAQKEANALAATKSRLLDTGPNPLAGP